MDLSMVNVVEKKMKNYDTKEGIQNSLHSLEAFNQLISERREAGYKRKERLNSFIVLGRYWFDGCGNVGVASDRFIPAEHIPHIPPVLSSLEMQGIMEEYDKRLNPDVLTEDEINAPDFDFSTNKRPYPTSISYSMTNTIPSAHIKCPMCNENWNIKNTHDIDIKKTQTTMIDLTEFIGKSFLEVQEIYNKRTDAIYMFGYEKSIRNDKHIDLTPDPKYKSLKINERGWITVDNNYIIQPGDEAGPSTWTYYHKECIKLKARKDCEKHLNENGVNYEQGNLAGRIECNPYVKLELKLAGIDLVENDKYSGEVPTIYSGKLNTKLGEFTFRRAWYYWVVQGVVPNDIAKRMYENPEGRTNVRVDGDCTSPPPNGSVDLYHIDSWEGLKLFADSVKGRK